VCWATHPPRSVSPGLTITLFDLMFDPLDHDVDPCIGFIIHEPASLPAPRKLVILGDTSSAAGLTALVSSTPGRLSLLVHEATDAHMPEDIDTRFAARGPFAVIAAKAKEPHRHKVGPSAPPFGCAVHYSSPVSLSAFSFLLPS
jgi:hypothetical protein